MYSISQFDGDLFSEMYRLQRQMRQTFDLGSPPTCVEAPENSLEFEATCAWISMPITSSQSCLIPAITLGFGVS